MKNKKYIIGMATIKSSLNPRYLEFVHDSIEIIRKMFFFIAKYNFLFQTFFLLLFHLVLYGCIKPTLVCKNLFSY